MEKTLLMTFIFTLALGIKDAAADQFSISSPAFQNNQRIPVKYTGDGQDINPPLRIDNIPLNTKSLALIVDDPDAPKGTWVHWVVYNIPPAVREIKEKSVPGMQGYNNFEQKDYGGPYPPNGTHRYFFKVYALDSRLDIPEKEAMTNPATKTRIENAMQGHVLAQARLVGLYSRNKE